MSLSAHAPAVTTAPAAQAVRIEPVAPVTQPIRIEVGKDIAKSVEIKQVPGNEIKVLSSTATVIHTPPPTGTEPHVEGHHVEVSPAPTARATSSPRSTP